MNYVLPIAPCLASHSPIRGDMPIQTSGFGTAHSTRRMANPNRSLEGNDYDSHKNHGSRTDQSWRMTQSNAKPLATKMPSKASALPRRP